MSNNQGLYCYRKTDDNTRNVRVNYTMIISSNCYSMVCHFKRRNKLKMKECEFALAVWYRTSVPLRFFYLNVSVQLFNDCNKSLDKSNNMHGLSSRETTFHPQFIQKAEFEFTPLQLFQIATLYCGLLDLFSSSTFKITPFSSPDFFNFKISLPNIW